MDSRKSRHMGLRELILGVAVSGFSTLSSCIPLAIAGGYTYAHQVDKTNEANLHAARIQADAIRDAGGNRQNQSNSNRENIDTVSYSSQAERDIAKYGSLVRDGSEERSFFACTSARDLNNNGIIELQEVSGVNNCFSIRDSVNIYSSSFFVWEVTGVAVSQTNFDYILVNLDNGIKLDSERKANGQMNGKVRPYDSGFFEPGNYRAMISSSKKGVLSSFDFKIENSTVANK